MGASLILTVSVVLLFLHPHPIVSGELLINCGSKLNSISLDGRKWTGESASTASISGQSTTSVVATTSAFLGADPVPYTTSRISSSPFHFTFHLSPGHKFIRLHFYPASYRGFDMSLDRFTVKAGPFTLLRDFSPTHHSSSTSKFFVKEFCLNVEQHGKLRVSFSPSNIAHMMTYAFVNGIEIVSMPTGLYYTPDGNAGASVVGQNNRFYAIDNRTALGLVQRLNNISPVEDYRNAYFQGWKTSAQQLKIPITSGFGYLVRLHFCDREEADGEQKELSILIDNQIAELSADVGFPVYKDYVVAIKGDEEEESEYDLFIALDGLCLKGIEVFRLSNLQNSLATSCGSPAVLKKVATSNWNLMFSLFSRRNLVIILIVETVVYWLRIMWEESSENNVNNGAAVEPSCRRFPLADIRSATQDFSDARVLGRGGYGKVYKGLIHGFQDPVAIKRLCSISRQGAREFRAEIESLSKLQHLNLVGLIGYCDEDEEMILVYEYIPGGTLDDNLGKNALRGKDHTFLSWEDRLGICIGVARGLEYLHTGSEPGIIHRDVKGTNILLDEKLVAKLEESDTHISTHFKGTRGYLDPHYRSTRRSTKKTDVYSFGVVMLVVLTGTGKGVDTENLVDYFSGCTGEEFDSEVDAEIRNSISAASLREFVKCVKNCLQIKPENRPSMAQLVVSLEQVLQLQREPPVQHIESPAIETSLVPAPFPVFPWMNPGAARNEKMQDVALVVPNQPNGGASKSPLPWIIRWLPLTTGKCSLPVDYRDILSRSPDGLALLGSSMPKKRLYRHLCHNAILIDNRTMSFSLDKATGKKNIMMSARALNIVWGEDPQYWRFIPLAKSRFNSVASLVTVCWLEIYGVISSKMMSPNTKYTFNLVFAVTSSFNWVNYPTEVSVGFDGQQWQTKYIILDLNGSGVLGLRTPENTRKVQVQTQAVKQRSDGWLEIELGEIYIKEGEDRDIGVRVAEVETMAWKHGLVVEGIDIRAKME